MKQPKLKIIPHKLTDKKTAQIMEEYINYIYEHQLKILVKYQRQINKIRSKRINSKDVYILK